MAQVDKIARETPGVAHTVAISGMSFLLQANASNFGSMFVVLDPFDKRQSPGLHADGHHGPAAAGVPQAGQGRRWSRVRNSSPIPGLGVAGGFKLMVEDRGGLGLAALQNQTDALTRKLTEPARPGRRVHAVPLQHAAALPGHRPDQGRVPGRVARRREPDARRCTWARSTSTASTSSAGTGRSPSRPRASIRNRVEDINLLQVRNKQGQMVPLGTLVNVARDRRPARRHALQPVPRRGRSPATCGRASAPATPSTAIDATGRRDPAAVDEGRVDRADVPADPGGQHRRCTSSRWRSCASSWSWRPCTRAGRCRWRSSWSCRCACSARWPACCYTDRDVNIFVQIGLVVLVAWRARTRS